MIDAEDRELFAQSLRHATENHTGPALDAALVDLGWPAALAAEPQVAVSLLFELQGATNTVSAALDQVLASALGVPASTVLLPPIGRWHAPGTADGDRFSVHGILFGDQETALLVARTGGSHVAVEVELPSRRAIEGLDPVLGLAEVEGTARGLGEPRLVDWPSAVMLGQLALAHELVGAARRMVDLAREHAMTRVQFGRPIAGFQAVRHRLAEAHVAVEAAAATLTAAWLDSGPLAAAMAKAVAGRAARVSARHCQQVLAGIGFTAEHPFHRHVRRTMVLDQLLGAANTLTRAQGTEILEHRRLPTLLPL